MGFPKGASIPFGQGRGQYPAREVVSFIDPAFDRNPERGLWWAAKRRNLPSSSDSCRHFTRRVLPSATAKEDLLK